MIRAQFRAGPFFSPVGSEFPVDRLRGGPVARPHRPNVAQTEVSMTRTGIDPVWEPRAVGWKVYEGFWGPEQRLLYRQLFSEQQCFEGTTNTGQVLFFWTGLCGFTVQSLFSCECV